MSGTVREQIAEQISRDNPDYVVRAYPAKAPDNLGGDRTAVSVYRDSLVQHQTRTALTHTLTIEILSGATAQPGAEDEIDAALDQVLLSIERMSGVRFISATRTVFDDRYNGYSVSVEADSANPYKTLVIAERNV